MLRSRLSSSSYSVSDSVLRSLNTNMNSFSLSDLDYRVIRVVVALEGESDTTTAPVLVEPAFEDPGIYLRIKDCKSTGRKETRSPRPPNVFLGTDQIQTGG